MNRNKFKRPACFVFVKIFVLFVVRRQMVGKKWHRKPLSPVPEESGRCCSALNSSYYRKTEQRRESGGCQGRGPDFPPLITRKSWRVSLKLYKNELTCGRRRNERSVQPSRTFRTTWRRMQNCRTSEKGGGQDADDRNYR